MTEDQLEPAGPDEQMIEAFMGRLHSMPLDDAPRMPDAAVLWLKAGLIRRWDSERRVRRPLDLMEPFELAAGLAAAVLLLAWSLPSAFTWLPVF